MPEEDRLPPLAALHQAAGMLVVRLAGAFRPGLSLGVRLVALDDRGGVFLVRHSYLPGLHLPGGAVDENESCRQAAIREAEEEGSLVLDAEPELFGVYHNPAGGRRDHVVLYVARGVRQARKRRPGLEIVSARFHPLDALPADVTSGTRRRLAEVAGEAPRSEDW